MISFMRYSIMSFFKRFDNNIRLRWVILFLVVVTIAAHGLTLLNDGFAYDAWLMYINRQHKRYDLLWRYYTEHRIPHIALLHWFIGYTPNLALTYAALSVATLLSCCVMVFLIARQLSVGFRDSLLMAVFSLIYPSYQTLAASGTYIYQVHLLFFFAGALCALYSQKYYFSHKMLFYRLRFLALVLFFFSFNTGSLLVFYVAFIVLYMFLISKPFRPIYLLKNFDLFLCPMLFWVMTRWVFFPTPPIFNVAYNTPKLEYMLDWYAGLRFAVNSILGVIKWSFEQTPAWLPLLFVVLLSTLNLGVSAEAVSQKYKYAISFTLFGVFCWVCATFAYIAVGKIATLHGHDTRFALLVSYAMAIMVTGLLKILLDAVSNQVKIAGWVLTLTLCASFIFANNDNNLAWLARWVKMNSVIVNLPVVPNISNVSILIVQDEFVPIQTESVGWSLMESYFDWTGVLQLALGPRVVSADQLALVDLAEKMNTPEDRAFIRQYYLVDQFDPQGCRAKLTIQRAAAAGQMGQFGMVRRYLYYRYLAPAGLNSFLRGLSTLNMSNLSAACGSSQ
jgi:hypothetical protein